VILEGYLTEPHNRVVFILEENYQKTSLLDVFCKYYGLLGLDEKKEEKYFPQHDAVPAEGDQRVGLDIAQQPQTTRIAKRKEWQRRLSYVPPGSTQS